MQKSYYTIAEDANEMLDNHCTFVKETDDIVKDCYALVKNVS